MLFPVTAYFEAAMELAHYIPSNPEYSVHQVKVLLRQVEGFIGRPVTLEEWENL